MVPSAVDRKERLKRTVINTFLDLGLFELNVVETRTSIIAVIEGSREPGMDLMKLI